MDLHRVPVLGLDTGGQEASGFGYGSCVCQAGYSRNLWFASGAQRQDLSGRIWDRTRSRLDIPAVRAVFGLAARPHRTRKNGPPAREIVAGKPRYGLCWFRLSFGRLQVKACIKGGHGPRFEAAVRNAKEPRCRSLDNVEEIITRPGRRARPGPRPRGVHRRRAHCPGPADHRERGLHHPAGAL